MLVNRISGSKEFSKDISFDESFDIFNKTLECAGSAHDNEELKLDVGTDANVDLKIAVTVSVSGSLTSLKLTNFTAITSKRDLPFIFCQDVEPLQRWAEV